METNINLITNNDLKSAMDGMIKTGLNKEQAKMVFLNIPVFSDNPSTVFSVDKAGEMLSEFLDKVEGAMSENNLAFDKDAVETFWMGLTAVNEERCLMKRAEMYVEKHRVPGDVMYYLVQISLVMSVMPDKEGYMLAIRSVECTMAQNCKDTNTKVFFEVPIYVSAQSVVDKASVLN